MSFWKKASRFGFDGFLVSLLGVILLAYLFPYPGTTASPFRLGEIANLGVSIIFFFYGLRLGFRKLRDGLVNWRLHLFIQAATFLLFPLIGLAIRPFFQGESEQLLWLGIFFLCILPSTVSSSVVMVGIAGGNIPAAIFNASISSLIGVFLTPVWLGLVFSGPEAVISVGEVVADLAIRVIFPVIAGMALFPWKGAAANRYGTKIRIFDQSVILLIVYVSFCQSFSDRLFEGLSYTDLAWLCLGMTTLFFLVYRLTGWLSSITGFNRADKITVVFCGSKKSLMQGALMANVMFAGTSFAGIILLPIMIYHSLQLVFVGVLAQQMSRELQ